MESGALSPRLLADLLEAMLADSDHGRTLRGGLGVFYTPDREVDALCRMLLFAQLSRKLSDRPAAVELLEQRLLAPVTRCDRSPDVPMESVEPGLVRAVLDSLATTSWCDPACGGGNFLTAAARVMAELSRGLSAQVPVLPFLSGMDRMAEAVAVTSFRLSACGEVSYARAPHIRHGDALEQLARCGDGSNDAVCSALEAPEGFDVVVGNPPYVRHERLGLDDGSVVAALTDAVQTRFPFLGSRKLGRSDLYAWFFPLAALLLRKGGHLGYVVSDSWLDSENGEWLRAFLSSELHARLVLQDPVRRSFSLAGVSTVLLVAQRPSAPSPEAPPGPAFLPWNGGCDESSVKAALLGALHRHGNSKRWGPNLRTTEVVETLRATGRLVPLGSLARLVYGSKPGIRIFFVLRRIGEKNGGIEREFLVPIVTSARDIPTGSVEPDHLTQVAFVCPHSIFELESRPDAAGALAWIRRGEGQVTRSGARHTRAGIPWPQARSVRSRPGGWYRFEPRAGLDFLVPCLLGSRFLLPANPHHLPATNQFFHGGFRLAKHRNLGIALLQSTVVWRLVEWFGRRKGLGGLNLYGYDLEQLPFPDPAAFSRRQAASILSAWEPVRRRPVLAALDESGGGDVSRAPLDRRHLDEAVLEALGLPSSFLPELYQDFAESVRRRIQKGRG